MGRRDNKASKAPKADSTAAEAKNSSAQNERIGGTSISYLTREGFRNVWTNRLMSAASIAVLTSCLVLIGCAAMFFLNINTMFQRIEAQNIVMVFVKDGLSQRDIDRVGDKIRTTRNVAECKFVPKEESYKQQLKSLGNDAELLEGLDNPLPDAYKVTLKHMDEFTDTVASLKKIDNILNIRENSELASQLSKIRKTVTYVSVAIILLLLTVSLFIIANTIKVTMFSRRLEISIMKAVGATNGFIRWPFMVEGILLGVIASVVSILIVLGVYSIMLSSFGDVFSMLGGSPVPFADYAWQMLASFLAIGIAAGIFGSTVSIKKYLKEQESVIND